MAEVVSEYSVGSGRVDYCLARGASPLVFVEVKRLGESLADHQHQLLRYSFEQGVTIAALTDGMRWWLYLPTQPGGWEQRRFFTVDMEEQDPVDAAAHFRLFLTRTAVFDGSALRAAQTLHADREKDRRMQEAMPSAWRELCEHPDEALITLLSEKVEGLCGHRPDPDSVEEFIAATVTGQPNQSVVAARPVETARERPVIERIPLDGQWTFQKPVAFTFSGHRYPVSKFKDILVQLATILYNRNSQQFAARVVELRSTRGREFYSREADQMQEAREVGRSGLFVETGFSANDIRRRCHELLAAFGITADALTVELRPKG